MRRLRLGFGIVAVPIIGCAQPSGGDGLNVVVSPLQLPGIGAGCYDLAVYAGQDATRQTVWTQGDPTRTALGQDQALPPSPTNPTPGPKDTKTICSTVYGNSGGGDITYIGTCDASNDSSDEPGVQNDVTLWFDGLYSVDGGKLKAEIGEWRDPCPNGCTLSVDCEENKDTLVRFDFTIMREAQQGFFDIAVNFEDVFCSAKVDCEYADGRPIEALFDANGDRQQTAIAALACTAGPGNDTGTVLHMNGVRVECGDVGGSEGRWIALPFTCIEGEGAFGVYWTLIDGQQQILPIDVGCAGRLHALALARPRRHRRCGDAGAWTMTTSLGSSSARTAMASAATPTWPSGRSPDLRVGALGHRACTAVDVDFFEDFDCVGTLTAGRCLSRAEGQAFITVWELSNNTIGAPTQLPVAAGYARCPTCRSPATPQRPRSRNANRSAAGPNVLAVIDGFAVSSDDWSLHRVADAVEHGRRADASVRRVGAPMAHGA